MMGGPDNSPDRPPAPNGALALLGTAGLVLLFGIGIVGWALLTPAPPAAPVPEQKVSAIVAPASQTAPPAPAVPASGETVALGPVPDPALVATGPGGPLPIVSADGRKPWQVYARPFSDPANRPRIAIVVAEIGLNSGFADAAIALPPEMTLAVSPYAADGQNWVAKARAAGHEVLLSLPMEPVDYPDDDPGPLALLTSLSPDENAARLQQALGRITGYAGIVNAMGGRFTASRTSLAPVIDALSFRGLMLLDARTAANSLAAPMAAESNVPHARVDLTLDATPSADAIRLQLDQLERTARAYGAAVGLIHAYPVSVRTVADWAKDLGGSGVVLAPVTALAGRQPPEPQPPVNE